MKYFTHNGSRFMIRVFPEPEDTWVASNATNHYTFKTRQEALEFCKEHNRYLKVQYHYRTFKIEELENEKR